ncbi:MAG: citramalate synthase [Bacillota bacterium]|nr:citramalate synthase [Bacillota bacterium]
MGERITIYDTTLRDGAQREGVSFSVEDKLRLVRRLDRLGVHLIEGGWPGANPKDSEFFAAARDLPLAAARLAAFGSTRRPGVAPEQDANLQALLDAGTPVVTLFGKAWDFHVTAALKTTLEENLAMIRESVAYLVAAGREAVFDAEHFFDGYKRAPEYALACLAAAVEGGARTLVLCDTNGGSLPGEVVAAVTAVRERFPGVVLGIHAHNDSGLAVANSLLAVEAGVRHVQGTINGYGERCGNADLCSLLPLLQVKLGFDCLSSEQLASLTRTAHYVAELANLPPQSNQPFVGRSAFAHKGGVHVSALMRHPETYEHLPPEAVGNERRVLVSDQAGAANVRYKAEEYHLDLDRHSSTTRLLLDTIKNLEYQGYSFEGAEASFELLMKKMLGIYQPFFELIEFRLISEKREHNGEPLAEATVKLRVGEQVKHTVAEGDGPVNALDKALRLALQEAYPRIAEITLTDFKVRVLDGKAGTAAKVRVLIESRDAERAWGTVGVSTNIIEASWRALVDSIEYGLMLETRS